MLHNLRYAFLVVLLGFFFSQARAQVQVISPNGGEIWTDGTPALISFENTGTTEYFVIELSTDNGSTWTVLQYVYAWEGVNEVYYYYSLPGASTEAKIKVTSENSPSVTDESDNPFTIIIPAHYIYNPMPGDSFYQGENIVVQWFTDNSNPVNIEFTSDNGVTWTMLDSAFTSYFYGFTAPDILSDECAVRLSDATDPSINTVSGLFSITTPPSITLLSPNGGEIWDFDEEYTVTWTGENLNNYVMVQFSADGGSTWNYLAAGVSDSNGGSTVVTPMMLPTTNARVRVSDYYFSQAYDDSDADFTVNAPAFMVYSPYDGDAFYAGNTIYVQWYTYLSVEKNIEISYDNGATFQILASNLSVYDNYVPVELPMTTSETCILKVVDSGNPENFGLSGTFRIIPLPELTLTFPVGGEILDNDSTYNVSWTLSGEMLYYASGTIELSMNNGVTWEYIGWVDLEQSNSFEWTTPLQLSDQCMIRITDYYNENLSDASTTFSIKDFPTLNICMVSVDSLSGKNVIIWNKAQSELINEYVVLKESNQANVYVEVGSVSSTAVAVVTDELSNPTEKATRYKLTFRDASGNLYPESKLHQTIHLSINKGVGDTWNLYWNSYLGFEVSSYNIYRGTTPDDMQMIGTVSGNFTSYSDLNAGSGVVYYMVEVLNPNNCDPERSGKYSSSRSNIATNKSLGLFEGNAIAGLSVYPNPASEMVRIITSETFKGTVNISVISAYGNIINQFETNSSELNKGYELNVNGFSSGIYTIMVSAEGKIGTNRLIIK